MLVRGGLADGELIILGRGNAGATPALTGACRSGDILVHNHPSGVTTPSDADLDIATRLAEMGVASAIVDNGVEEIYFIVEPHAFDSTNPIDPDEVEAFLSPGGPLAKTIEGYEHRDEQTRMARSVAGCLSSVPGSPAGVMLIEAGTGTGKSIAYLVPSILWARRNGRKVVISTATINLQEQLLKKDIPQIETALGTPVKAALVKGRGNYLCLRKLDAAAREPGLFFDPSEMDALSSISDWAQVTTEGSREEILFKVPPETWERVCSESDYCTGLKCPRNSRCFVNRARRAAAAAEIVVVNHHLLCADLALFRACGCKRHFILPDFNRVIIDEAHHLEGVAYEHFGASVSRLGFRKAASRLLTERGDRGCLRYLMKEAERVSSEVGGEVLFHLEAMRTALNKAHAARKSIGRKIEESFASLEEAAASLGRQGGRQDLRRESDSSGGQSDGGSASVPSRVRLRREHLQGVGSPLTATVIPAFREALSQARKFAAAARDMAYRAENLSDSIGVSLEQPIHEAKVFARRVEAHAVTAMAILDSGKPDAAQGNSEPEWDPIFSEDPEAGATGNGAAPGQAAADPRGSSESVPPCNASLVPVPDTTVRWIETTRGGKRTNVRLVSSPLEVGPHLRQALYEPMASTVLTSATLAVNGGFEYFSAKVGLGGGSHPHETMMIGSPFDFHSQSLLAIPTDMPEPDAPDFTRDAGSLIADAITVTEGRAMVLFTSYRMMESFHSAVAAELDRITSRLDEPPYQVMRQGSESRHLTLFRFKSASRGVLFGTDSFWEGVDVPGDALSLLIIARLPFRSPGDPLVEAKCEAIEASGKSSFREFMLPEAVIKFRQGFGRLIRTREDKGTVLVLDTRILKRSYGSLFLDSLPGADRCIGTREKIVDRLVDFFEDAGTW